jgi:hypothetical protein
MYIVRLRTKKHGIFLYVRFEVFLATTVGSAVIWDAVTGFFQEPHGFTSQKTAFFTWLIPDIDWMNSLERNLVQNSALTVILCISYINVIPYGDYGAHVAKSIRFGAL